MECSIIGVNVYVLATGGSSDSGLCQENVVAGRLGGMEGVREQAGLVQSEVAARKA